LADNVDDSEEDDGAVDDEDCDCEYVSDDGKCDCDVKPANQPNEDEYQLISQKRFTRELLSLTGAKNRCWKEKSTMVVRCRNNRSVKKHIKF